LNELILDVSDLLRSIGSEKRVREAVRLPRIKHHEQELCFAEPIDMDIVISNVGERLLVEGSIKGGVMLGCCRCLASFKEDFDLDVRESFCLPGQCVDDEAFQIVDKKIDLGSLVIQALFLWLPMKLLCRVDCKGLCSTCGKNLNEGKCGCKEPVDPRLAVLKDLFEKGT